MVGTIIESDTYVNQGISGDDPSIHCFPDSFFHCRNVIARYGAADDLIDEFKPFAVRQGFHLEPGIAVLTASTGLLLQFSLSAGTASDCLLVGHLRRFENDFGAVLPFKLLDDDFDVL